MSVIPTLILLVLLVLIIYIITRPSSIMFIFQKWIKKELIIPPFPDIPKTEIQFKDYTGNVYKLSKNTNTKYNEFSSVVEMKSSFDSGNESVVDSYNWFTRTLAKQKTLEEKPQESLASDVIILWVHGGGFVIEKPYFNSFLLNLVKQVNMDLYSFDYPTLVQKPDTFVLQYMMVVFETFKGKNIILLGDSAGAFYILLLLQMYKSLPFNIKAVMFIHPFLGMLKQPYKFIFEHLVAKNYQKITQRVVQQPMFVLNSNLDAFYEETSKLKSLMKHGDVYAQIDCPLCTHDFPFIYPTLDKSMQALNYMVNFIKNLK